MQELTPRQIVAELDKYIIGQLDAKKSVAVALRNRYRRKCLGEAIQDEIMPKNIIMIGPTGVGKTEIARRLARLVSAPFIKVEATKYTEVGYVGRDVEGIIRDLTETAVRMVKAEQLEQVRPKGEAAAEERLVELLAPTKREMTNPPRKSGSLWRITRPDANRCAVCWPWARWRITWWKLRWRSRIAFRFPLVWRKWV